VVKIVIKKVQQRGVTERNLYRDDSSFLFMKKTYILAFCIFDGTM